jgi:hypothetical protein
MAFPSGSRDLAGGVAYDDALQLLLLRQPPNNFYPQGQVDYPPQPSSTSYRLEHDNYPRVYTQAFSEDPPLQPPPQPGTGQQKEPHDFASVLDELRQGILSIQTKCDNLEATVSELQDSYAFHQVHSQNIADGGGRTKTLNNDLKEYFELLRAWCLILKRRFESRDRRAAESEDSDGES